VRSYQSVLILKPDFDEAQVDSALEAITGLIQSHDGECLKVDKWGKKRLAYKVRKNRFGYYLNIDHTCENEKVPSLEAKYKLFDPILKFMVIRLDEKELERAMGEHSEQKVSQEAESPVKEKKTVADDSDTEEDQD